MVLSALGVCEPELMVFAVSCKAPLDVIAPHATVLAPKAKEPLAVIPAHCIAWSVPPAITANLMVEADRI